MTQQSSQETGRVRNFVEGIGLLAVVLSLIFVGFEIRQNTVATRSATQQAIYQAGIESNMNVMNNTRLRELLVVSGSDSNWIETAPRDSDFLLLRRFYMNRFNNLENAFYHFRAGTYDAELWDAQAGWIGSLLSDNTMSYFWQEVRIAYMREFRDYLDQRYAEGMSTSLDN